MDALAEPLKIVLVVAASVFAGLMVLGVLVVVWSRKAQQRASTNLDESMELSRESVAMCRRGIELQEKTNALMETMIENQREIIELLRSRTGAESRIRA